MEVFIVEDVVIFNSFIIFVGLNIWEFVNDYVIGKIFW